MELETSCDLIGASIVEDEVPNELKNISWIIIAKGAEIASEELGVFFYQREYLIRKKRLSTDGKIILIGKNEMVTVIDPKNKYKEIGKIIKGLKNF